MWTTLVNRYARGYRGVLLLIVIVVVVAAGAAVALRQRGGSATKTVFVIVMENQNGSDIVGNPAAPYINSVLLPQASYAARYFNPPGIHPSLPNYLWMEAGTNFGVTQDVEPSDAHQSTSAHLVTLLAKAGISWKAYEESISGTACPLYDRYPYAARHNPFVYFDDVTNQGDMRSPYCIAHERPYTELAGDLQRNTVARYNFITPNVCDDMHDSCAPLSNSIKQGDTWLARAVPPILNSDAYKSGGMLFIVWDEAESGDGPIPLMMLSPYAKGHGYRSTVRYTHSSLLRTLEDIFGVSPYLGGAANATPLRDLFTVYP
ncbi:MAG TPA: alkaline phosphatase family protein [Chloroflexota bacterium]|nr:alkaline phosphatase family protein [Chloroflexota bacterium]